MQWNQLSYGLLRLVFQPTQPANRLLSEDCTKDEEEKLKGGELSCIPVDCQEKYGDGSTFNEDERLCTQPEQEEQPSDDQQEDSCGEHGSLDCWEQCQRNLGSLVCSEECRCVCEDGWKAAEGSTLIPGLTPAEDMCTAKRPHRPPPTCEESVCAEELSESDKIRRFLQQPAVIIGFIIFALVLFVQRHRLKRLASWTRNKFRGTPPTPSTKRRHHDSVASQASSLSRTSSLRSTVSSVSTSSRFTECKAWKSHREKRELPPIRHKRHRKREIPFTQNEDIRNEDGADSVESKDNTFTPRNRVLSNPQWTLSPIFHHSQQRPRRLGVFGVRPK
eukprot:gb/GECG01002257.1/.p1 GENE.gb/GECG01002257.1/~~gb/GECG01002257.1/.p1  ORF type:complete len:333 (+),score=33.85 gb/GECG01002257.1/:1-999(+)